MLLVDELNAEALVFAGDKGDILECYVLKVLIARLQTDFQRCFLTRFVKGTAVGIKIPD